MGVFRAVLVGIGGAMFVAALPACSSEEPSSTTEAALGEPPRVPDPPPRYKRTLLDAGVVLPPGEEPGLQIKCGGLTPYVCSMRDGTFRCSGFPCLPDCSRVGCVGGDVCLPCEGGYQCVASGGSC